MVTVALAGATTGFGLTVLNHFLHTSHPRKIVLLTRSPQPHLSAQGIGVRPVDYPSHSSLVSALQNVHTILSLIGGSASALQDSQLALLAAAKEAGVSRFAPSEYAGNAYNNIDLYAGKRIVWDAVRTSGLEYTHFDCGIFMNTFATGTPKGEKQALANLRPWNFMVNMSARTADLPDSGEDKIVFAEMNDVARFVIAALDLETWPEILGMRGDVETYLEAIAIAENVQQRRFSIRENSVEEMRKHIREKPETGIYSHIRIALTGGRALVGRELNDAFPDTKPGTLEEFVRMWWEGVQVGEASWGGENTTFAFE